MKDDSSLIKGFANFIACVIVAIGYFDRPTDASFVYFLKLSFLAISVAVAGLLIAALDERRTQRRRDKLAAKILKRLKTNPSKVKTNFFVYLRPFFTTGNMPVERQRGGLRAAIPLLPRYFEDRVDSRSVELEKMIAKALVPSGLLIGLGKPGEQIGAGRIVTGETNWQNEVCLLVKYAKLLILIPSERPGTRWEVCLMRDGGYLEKCIFIMPPKLYFSSIDIESVWEQTFKILRKDGFNLPAYCSSGLLFTLTKDGTVRSKLPLSLESETSLRRNVYKLLKLSH